MQLPPPDVLASRAHALRQALADKQIDVLVVTSLPNISYLTGFYGSSATLILDPAGLNLISDGRYAQALAERGNAYPAIRPIELLPGANYDATLVETLQGYRGLAVGIEASHLSVARLRYLARELEQQGMSDTLHETEGVVESLRVRKDSWEVARIRDGAGRLSDVAKCIISKDLTGLAEFEIAAEIDAALRRAGFVRPAFDTIVAGGPNAALPHGRPTGRRIEQGDVVLLDFGGVLDGYCTDLSRTLVMPPADAAAARLIAHVVDAQAAAFSVVRPGAAPEAVDQAARESLAAAGLGDAFSHGTGHGLGLEIHEAPRVSRRRDAAAEPPLDCGMVMTLEPGAYLPGWGGVRIEDDVLVTGDGAEWLTDVPRQP